MAPQGNLVIASFIVLVAVVSGKPYPSSDQDNYGKDLKSNYQNQWTGWGERKPTDNWNGWGEKPVDYGWGEKKPVDNGWGEKKPVENWNGWGEKKSDENWNGWGEKNTVENWNGWGDKRPADNGWGEKKPLDNGWGEKKPVENWNGWGEKRTDENWNGKGEKNTVENWNGWGEKKPVDLGWGEKKPVENWNGWGEKKTDENWNGWGEKNTVENWNAWGEKKPVDNGWGEKKRVDYGWGEKAPVDYGWGEKAPIDYGWGEKAPVDYGWGEKGPLVDFGNLWSGWGDKPDSKLDLVDDEKERHVAVFIQIMKSLINREEEDTRSFLELFKQFTRVSWKKDSARGNSKEELSKSQVATYEKISYNDEREWLDLCDGDEPDNEFRYKKLFLLYIKFRSHYQAQKQYVGAKDFQYEQLKASKQYILFAQLVAFAKQVQHEKTIVLSFSQIVEAKYKTHYSNFKQCAFYSQCNRWTDFDFDGKSGFDFGGQFGNAIGDNYDRDAKHFELFLKLQKFIKLLSDNTYDDDSFRTFRSLGWYDDVIESSGEHPVYGYLSGLRKHLDDHKPTDFKRFFDDKEEADNKALFFSLKGYRLLKEHKELLEKRVQTEQIFVKFSKFLQYQEEVENCNQEFYKFKEWQKAKENKVRVDEFFSFLKQVSVLKGYFQAKTYYGRDGSDRSYNKGVGQFYYGYDKSVRLAYDGKDSTGFNKFRGGNDFGRKDFGDDRRFYQGFPQQRFGQQGFDYQREDFYKNQLAQAGYSKEKLNFDRRH